MSLYIPNLATDEPVGLVQGLAGNFNLLEGSLVESGSNENGEYVRWENGLQICWRVVTLEANTPPSLDTIRFPLPAVFIAPSDQVHGWINWHGRHSTSDSSARLNASKTIYRFFMQADTASWYFTVNETIPVNVQFCVLAIGRWK